MQLVRPSILQDHQRHTDQRLQQPPLQQGDTLHPLQPDIMAMLVVVMDMGTGTGTGTPLM